MAIWMSSDLVFLLLTTLENMQISTYMAYILSLIGKQWQTLKILGEGVNKMEDIQI
jgi:predicted ester cyclase